MNNEQYKIKTAASLYTNKFVDFKREPIFFGSGGKNTQRFDDPKYPFYDKSNDTQQGFDWKHNEVPLITDAVHFKTLLKVAEKHATTRTLQKLIFLDSLNGRGPFLIFGQATTLPEFENVVLTWTYFEGAKHSRTYTEELRALYTDPDLIFNESFQIPELLAIADNISGPYDRAYFNVINWVYKTQRNIELTQEEWDELYDSMLMAWVEVNTLEGIRFYSGFASIWALKEGQGYLPGTSENLQLICRDENEHLSLSQLTLKILRKDESEGFVKYFEKAKDKIEDRYYEVYQEEVDWITNVIFEQGSYIGMNDKILIQYLNYLTIRRMKAIGLHPKKERLGNMYITKNPIPWINKYINMDKVEKLPQEEKVLNYITGGVKKVLQEGEIPDDIRAML